MLRAAALVLVLAAPVRLAAQVVINEIHYHPRSELKTEEFVELFNAGPAPADLSGWAFTSGIRFIFPQGASLPAGGYFAIAADAAALRVQAGLPATSVLGDFTGDLSNGGEAITLSDALGHKVDEVVYSDEFPWPVEADGLGPSLECLDPGLDNAGPRNWLPSQRSGNWVPIAIRGTATSNRLYLYLEGAGECLVDDLQVAADGSADNLFPAGDFEGAGGGWVMAGTHASSRIEKQGARSGQGVLHLQASGAGGTAADSINRPIDGMTVGLVYSISLWVKTLSGNTSFITRISGGGILARTELSRVNGTPGRENASRRSNLPPLIAQFGVEPVLPRPGEAVTLAAVIDDEDLAQAGGYYNTGDGRRDVELRDDGQSGDGAPGDGIFGARLPAAALGAIVEYGVFAIDGAGFRVDSPARRYAVANFNVQSNLPVYHIFIRPADWSRLNANIWTEEYFPAVFVHGGEVIPDARLRFRGGRPRLFRKKSLKLEFSKSHRFEGRDELNLNAAAMDDDYMTEPLAYWLYGNTGMETSRAEFVRVQLNGEFWGLFIDVEQVDDLYLQRWGLSTDGALYKAVGVVGSMRKLDGMLYNGQSFTYESQYEKKTRRGEPYDDLIGFINGMYSTPAARMEEYLESTLDVDQYINYLAASNLMCIWDNIQHNFYMYRDTGNTGKWRILPWDCDHAWGEWEWNYYYDATYHLLMGTEQHPFAGVWYTWNRLWTVLLNNPALRARYQQRIRDLLNSRFAEGPIFKKIDSLRAAIQETALLDEAKWPDSLEPQHTGPRRTLAQELPLLKQNISRRRTYMAGVVGIQLIDVPASGGFSRGDANGDGSVNLADAVRVLLFLFRGMKDIGCLDAADADDSGAIDIADPVRLLRHLFLGEPPPPFPGPIWCGADTTPDALDCAAGSCEGPGRP